jgi:hypothetical protein
MTDTDTLKHCIFSLLTGLEIQNIDSFMERLTPANCLKLGRAYRQAVRDRLAGEFTSAYDRWFLDEKCLLDTPK